MVVATRWIIRFVQSSEQSTDELDIGGFFQKISSFMTSLLLFHVTMKQFHQGANKFFTGQAELCILH